MSRFWFAQLAAALVGPILSVSPSTIATADTAVEPINGVDLTGWKVKGEASKSHWTLGRALLKPNDPAQIEVAPGGKEMINSAGAGMDIYTEQQFGDVHIELELMVPKGSDSGVYLMGEYELQVTDSVGKEPLSQQHLGAIFTAGPQSERRQEGRRMAEDRDRLPRAQV